jgi:hypothetical protein
MKFVAVVFLIAGVLCNSALASAEGPIPFSALEQAANAQPIAAVAHEATGNSTPVQVQSRPMTSGGKVMTGVGIGLLGLGVTMFAFGASVSRNDIAGGTIRGVSFGAGGGFAAIGTGLIYFGVHRRSSK